MNDHTMAQDPLRAALSGVVMFSARNSWLVLSLGIIFAVSAAAYGAAAQESRDRPKAIYRPRIGPLIDPVSGAVILVHPQLMAALSLAACCAFTVALGRTAQPVRRKGDDRRHSGRVPRAVSGAARRHRSCRADLGIAVSGPGMTRRRSSLIRRHYLYASRTWRDRRP